MEVSIIAIGDELLIGQVVDTNSGWIAQEITPYGWRVKSVRVVADNAKEIKKAVEDAFNETDIVLTTGGPDRQRTTSPNKPSATFSAEN